MQQESLESQIIKMIAEHLDQDPAQITPERSFEKDLKVDSMDAMDLLVAINERFETKIPLEEMENIETVQDMILAIQRNKSNS